MKHLRLASGCDSQNTLEKQIHLRSLSYLRVALFHLNTAHSLDQTDDIAQCMLFMIPGAIPLYALTHTLPIMIVATSQRMFVVWYAH